jgi:hypothetical protein
MTAPVAEQADECGREVRKRERVYPHLIENGRLRPDTADRKIALMADAERTLRFVAQHAAGLRALCHFLLASASPTGSPAPPTADEREALLAHPGVQGLLAVWPEAEVRIFGPAGPVHADAQRDLFPADHDQEQEHETA